MSTIITNGLGITLAIWQENSNNKFDRIATIDEITTLQVTYNWVNASTFNLTIPYNPQTAPLFAVNNMITIHDPANLGESQTEPFIITMLTIASSNNSITTIQIEGSNPLIWLGRRLILDGSFGITSSPTAIAQTLVNLAAIEPAESARIIPNLQLGGTPEFGETATFFIQEAYQNLLTTITTLLQAYNLGQNITFDLETGIFYYNILQGVDRSADQDTTNPIIYSPSHGNITGSSFQHTNVNYVNVCYGSVQISGTTYTTVTGSASGLQRFEGSVTGSDDTGTTITTSNYQEVLTLLAEQQMAKDAENKTTLGTIKEDTLNCYQYNVDFTLGDTITYFNKSWGVNMNATITEVNVQWSSNGKAIQIQLGQPLPTIAAILGISDN